MIRQQKKTVAEAELKEAESMINKTVESLLEESGLLVETEREQFASAIRGRLNKIKLGLIDKASQAELRMAKMNMKAQEKEAMRQAIFGLTQSGMSAAMGGFGGGSKGTGGTQPMKPQTGSASGASGYALQPPQQVPEGSGAGSPPPRVNFGS
jgi:hypothetical protein